MDKVRIIENDDWKFAKFSWLVPLCGFVVLIVGMLVNSLASSYTFSPYNNWVPVVLVILWLFTLIIGLFVTILCFIYSKKYKNTFKNGVIGVITFVVQSFMLAVCIIFFFSVARLMGSASKEEVFKEFVLNPVPHNVKLISGSSVSWQGFYATVSFRTDIKTFEQIVAGFEIIPKQIINGNYFSEVIKKGLDVIFYYGKAAKTNSEAHTVDYYYLVAWEKKKNVAHFYIGEQPAVDLERKKSYERFYSQFSVVYPFATEETIKQLKKDINAGLLPWHIDVEEIRKKYGEPDSIWGGEVSEGKTHYMLCYGGVNLGFNDNKLSSR